MRFAGFEIAFCFRWLDQAPHPTDSLVLDPVLRQPALSDCGPKARMIHLLSMKSYVMFAASALAVTASQSAFSQSAPILRVHTTEVGGFMGASYDIDKARVMGAAMSSTRCPAS